MRWGSAENETENKAKARREGWHDRCGKKLMTLARFRHGLLVLLLLLAVPSAAAAEEMPLPPAQPSAQPAPLESRRAVAEQIALVAAIGGALLLGGWGGSWAGALSEGEPRECYLTGGYTGLINSGSCTGGPNGEAVGLSLIPVVGSFMTVGARSIDGGRATLTGLLQVAGVLTLAIGLPMVISSRSSAVVTVSVGPGGLALSGSF